MGSWERNKRIKVVYAQKKSFNHFGRAADPPAYRPCDLGV
jgi:hypothetical protein